MNNVPKVPEGGNTKTPSRTKINPAKKWCFTINNYTASDIEIIKEDCSNVPKLMFQSEIGESGTSHIQGWLEFKTKKRPCSVFKSTKIHWEKMKGSIAQNILYCGKSSSHDGKLRYCRGSSFPYTGPIIELRRWQRLVLGMLNEKPHDRHIYWIWSESGNMGKTTFAKYVFHNVHKTIVTGGKATDMKNGVMTYIKQNDQFPKVVIIDVPRVNRGHFSVAGIEEIKNMFFFSGKYEGGMVSGPIPHVICFANCKPDIDNMSYDRWQIMDLEGSQVFESP